MCTQSSWLVSQNAACPARHIALAVKKLQPCYINSRAVAELYTREYSQFSSTVCSAHYSPTHTLSCTLTYTCTDAQWVYNSTIVGITARCNTIAHRAVTCVCTIWGCPVASCAHTSLTPFNAMQARDLSRARHSRTSQHRTQSAAHRCLRGPPRARHLPAHPQPTQHHPVRAMASATAEQQALVPSARWAQAAIPYPPHFALAGNEAGSFAGT